MAIDRLGYIDCPVPGCDAVMPTNSEAYMRHWETYHEGKDGDR